MYCEDTSTSSEDEASAAASTTTTTADMCRAEVRNGEKVLRCTSCGYSSDRRANVTRHYRRIHAELKREKYRECPCGQTFHTKWEFYKHCDDHHPNLRQSWYTTTHVYKLKQTKERLKLKPAARPYARPGASIKGPSSEGLATRASSRRLRSQDKPSTSSAESSNTSSDSGIGTSSTELSRCSFSSTTETSSEKERPFRISESSEVSLSGGSDISPEEEGSFPTSETKDTNNENAATSLAHLPIKKRYMETVRRVFGDITNKINVEKVNDCNNNINIQVPVRDSKTNDKLREYLNLIDFDELDAILKLRDMKKSV